MMRLTGSGVYTRPAPVPKMPTGLIELMEGLTREVLKHNPPNVYDFCANHMQELLLIRDGRAPKQHLTLEQKIKTAQEKIRQQAVERRRKYDKEMENLAVQISPKTTKDKESTISDTKKNGNETSEIENVKECSSNPEETLAEAKQKNPVHHDQDLADALEVEIFHKPVKTIVQSSEEVSKVVDHALPEKNISRISEEVKKQGKEEEKTIAKTSEFYFAEANQIMNSDFTLTDTNGTINNNHASSEESVVNKNYNLSSEHIQVQRSVNSQEKELEVEHHSEQLLTVEEKGSPGNFFGMDEDISVEKDTATTSSILLGQEHELDKNVSNDVKSSDPELVGSVETYKDTITNKLIENESNDDTQNHLRKVKKQIENIANSVDVKTKEDMILSENKIDNDMNDIDPNIVKENDKKVGDVNVKKEELYATEFMKHNSENQLTDVNEKTQIKYPHTGPDADVIDSINVSSSIIANDDVDKNDLQKNYNMNIMENERQESEGTGVLTEEKTMSINEPHEKDVKNKSIEVTNAELLGNTDMQCFDADQTKKVIESSNAKNHVTSSAKNEDQKQETTNKTARDAQLEGTPHNERKVDVTATDDIYLLENNDDGAVTTVDKVLVSEFAVIQDDNDSVPESYTEPNINHVYAENHVNGTHKISNGSILENGSESPKHQKKFYIEESIPEVSSQQIVIDETVDEVPENVLTAQYPNNKSNDTGSMDKTSSMDDSIAEGTINSILDVDTRNLCSNLIQNTNSMDLETAAVTIQKVFRSFLFKRGSTYDDASVDEGNMLEEDNDKVNVQFPVSSTPPINKERRTLGISRMDTVLQTVNEEKSLSLSTDDSSLSSAATIIQAHVRGFLVRNRMNSNKTNSMSFVNSDGPSSSVEADPEHKASKTVLNIHIVPEGEHFLSRDESLLTSIDLSLDGSPPSSTNLHPLGYDKSEPRKQLKREDAIQSISPPSNNSGKLSEDVESVKDMIVIDSEQQKIINSIMEEPRQDVDLEDRDDTPTRSTTIETVIEAHKITREISSSPEPEKIQKPEYSVTQSFDESDVVTPYEDKNSTNSDDTLGLLHSGEFHDVLLPTKVSRSDTKVVRGE